jgi:hypothetical protein
MSDTDDLARLKPQVTPRPAEEYDWLVAWLDEPDDEVDLENTRRRFQRPSSFTRDCE